MTGTSRKPVKDCTNNGFWPNYPRITLAELADYTWDYASAQLFARRFTPSLIIGTLTVLTLLCSPPVLMNAGLIDGFGFTIAYLAAVAFAFIGGCWRQKSMSRTRPVSAMSGLEMEPFIIQDLETPNHYELAYIDRKSGRYFRKIFAEMSS